MSLLARGIVLLPFILIFLASPSVGISAEPKKSPGQDQVARKKIAELESQVRTQAEQLNSIKAQMNESLKNQEIHTQQLDQSAKDHDKEITELKNKTRTTLSCRRKAQSYF